MAARDDTYRNQYLLDIIFAVSCFAMLASLVWMFAKDYYREFKSVQRRGREVEVSLLQMQALKAQDEADETLRKAKEDFLAKLEPFDNLKKDAARLRKVYEQQYPDNGSVNLALDSDDRSDKFVLEAKKLVPQARNADVAKLQQTLVEKKTNNVKLNDRISAERANRDSLVSQRDILVEQKAIEEAVAAVEAKIRAKEEEILGLEKEQDNLKREIAETDNGIRDLRKDLLHALDELEPLSRKRDALARTADDKRIGAGAKFRALWVIDAFNSPYRIDQKIPDGLLIDYNFKPVQRNDRCMTCHMFADRQGFEKDKLWLTAAQRRRLSELADAKKPSLPAADLTPAERSEFFELRAKARSQLSPSEVGVYASHPRLDLFVGSNSPHPVEKFGCTICHSGQGGSATFNFAYHFPDRGKTNGDKFESYAEKKERWEHEQGWQADLHPDYLWDFPMYPGRFLEATCLKCHNQVTDLIRTDGKEEAPKLLKGYRLVRTLGCFGCHEISGFKGGRQLGPDLRLEPYPPVEDLSPLERTKLTADPNDPPGQQRRVGPGLRRIAEKTTPDWAVKWIRSPRAFRPDTRMPHFFGLTNNHPTQLSDGQPETDECQVAPAQQGFPDAEVRAIAFYLFKASEGYLNGVAEVRETGVWAKEKELRRQFVQLDQDRRDNPALVPHGNDPSLPAEKPVKDLIALPPTERAKLTKDQLNAVLVYFAERERQFTGRLPLAGKAGGKDLLPFPPPEVGDYKPDANNGKNLFTRKGCFACHSHDAIKLYDDNSGEQMNKADFGPNLSSLKTKLGNQNVNAAKWLYYWLSDPSAYWPRTFMPNPQLEAKEKMDIIAWLLSESGSLAPPDAFGELKISDGDLKGVARAYLEKALPKSKIGEVVEKGLTAQDAQDLGLRPDAFERLLLNDATIQPTHEERLKLYVGKKAINRMGCFACHDIPGFEIAKPIGTALNDWGKKDPERLAFENVVEYVKTHHKIPRHGRDEDPSPHAAHGKDYDAYFYDALAAGRRDGFLYQKLSEPRGFDFDKYKDRPWDDRLRMPQFKFAHTKKRQNESDAEFHKREALEEQEAVEAVMTFILGLVADPVPLKFVNHPQRDRQNEIKGIQVLEKFNCIGCHILKPGRYEGDPNFAANPPARKEGDDDRAYKKTLFNATLRGQLTRSRNNQAEELKRDVYPYVESNAWASQTSPSANRLAVTGLPLGALEDGVSVEVWEALRFQDAEGKYLTFPAGLNPVVVPFAGKSGWTHQAPYGGTFAQVLAKIVDPRGTVSRSTVWGSVPPPLLREGQKVQTQWLFEFLQHPHVIRPTVALNLRMPQFNMSRDEAEALVNYFVAVDRLQNPALGLDYFGQGPVQRDAAFQERARGEYQAKLRQLLPQDERAKVDPAKADYFDAGWRMILNKKMCLNCHNVGNLKAEGKPEEKGPDLNMAADRLRPEYVERWVQLPKRFIPFTAMTQYEPFALKTPADADMRASLKEAEFALDPHERVEAVRDALFSWGYLAPPTPPAAEKVGPRGDPHRGQ